MRKSCLECVAKHLGSAAVYIEEVRMGYPCYWGYVLGELNHAASECMDKYPELAWIIREHRILWQSSYDTDLEHVIPFEAMFGYIRSLLGIDPQAKVKPPEELYEGLPRDEHGVTFSMDTR